MKVGDLVRMVAVDSVCRDEIGVIIDTYPSIERNLVFFYEKDCKIACLDNELEIMSENYYLNPNQGEG